MRLRTQRRVIYATMGLTVLALVGGFAAATLTLGGPTATVQQGSQTTTVTGVTGLSYTSTALVEVTSAPSGACGSSAASSCDVSATGVASCVGGLAGSTTCAVGDWVEQVSLTTIMDTAFTGNAGGIGHTVEITVYVVTGAGTTAGTSLYYVQTSGSNSAVPIVQDFDIGTSANGPAAVTTVTVIASG